MKTHFKLCQECRTQIYGRSDKKFCSIQCKNAFHNFTRRSDIHIQRSNSELLEMLHRRNVSIISKQKLLELGYRLDHNGLPNQVSDTSKPYLSRQVRIETLENGYFALVVNTNKRLS